MQITFVYLPLPRWKVIEVCCAVKYGVYEKTTFYHTLPYTVAYNTAWQRGTYLLPHQQCTCSLHMEYKLITYLYIKKNGRGINWVLGVRNQSSNKKERHKHKVTKGLIIICQEHTRKWAKVWFFKAHLSGHLTDERRHWLLIAIPIISVDSDWFLLYNSMMLYIT